MKRKKGYLVKNFSAAVIFSLIFCAASYCAAEGSGSGTFRHIDTGEEDSRPVDMEYGVNNTEMMPPYDSYDENTGLPNVVESDTAGELE